MTAHVASYLSAAAAADPSLALFTCGSRVATAKHVADRVAALAVGLAQRLGVQPGECVCLAALATDHNLEALLAITAAGGIAAPLNWRWGPAEGAHATGLVAARLLVADAACLGWAAGVAAACPGVRTLLLLGDPAGFSKADLAAASVPVVFAEALMSDCPSASVPLRSAPGNAALVVYTSGTTGKPKGVVLSHAALHVQSLAKLLVVGYRRADVYLHAAPLFHIGGLSSALAMLMAGARHVFLPRFDPAGFLDVVQSVGVTSFIAVPAMVAALVDAAGTGSASFGSVRTILLGGGGTPPALRRDLRALFPNAAVQTAYGMTEACSSMTFLALWEAPTAACTSGDSINGSRSGAQAETSAGGGEAGEGGPAGGVFVGAPPPGIELAIYRPPQGAASGSLTAIAARSSSAAAQGWHGPGASAGAASGRVAHEGEGEILTRGPHVMLGYWQDEEATEAAFLPGGWMRTGDLGCLRQGRLWLMGRAKDMIKSGGENVHAWEVERALGSHPAVAAAAVVGAADWRLGEAVAAVLVLRGGWEWRGPRCQVLLQAARAGAAAVAAAASAAAVASDMTDAAGSNPGPLEAAVAGSDLQGPASREAAASAALDDALAGEEGSPEEPGALQKLQAAAGWRGTSGAGQHLRSPAGGAPGTWGGLVAVGAQHGSQQAQRRHLQRVAQGLLQLDALGSSAGGSGGAGGSAAGGGEGTPAASSSGRWVDGPALQCHCRAAGLAGFKLPRVFLGLPTGEALPANSTGKVLKHLVRARVEREMQAAQQGGVAGPARPRL